MSAHDYLMDYTPPEPDDETAQRLLNLIFDIPPRSELLHERDCAACDISDEIAGMIAAYWDEDETWDKTPAVDGLPGDTKLTQLGRMIAHVLHRRTPGYQRPSEATIRKALAEDSHRKRNEGNS